MATDRIEVIETDFNRSDDVSKINDFLEEKCEIVKGITHNSRSRLIIWYIPKKNEEKD